MVITLSAKEMWTIPGCERSSLLGNFGELSQPGEEIDKVYLLEKHMRRRKKRRKKRRRRKKKNISHSTHSEISKTSEENQKTYSWTLLRGPLHSLPKPQFREQCHPRPYRRKDCLEFGHTSALRMWVSRLAPQNLVFNLQNVGENSY